MKKFFSLLLATFLLISCIPSYRIYPESYRNVKPDSQRVKAFVLNKELEREYIILEKSEIYQLVEDSSYQVKIKLNPMKRNWVCGNGMIGSTITLGLLPSILPDEYYYGFEEMSSKNKKFNFKLQVAQTLWLFNIFYPKSFKKQTGKALLASYKENNINN